MAVDVEALKALGLSDQEIAQIVAADAGGFQPITAAPSPVTNPVAGAYDYTQLYGGGDIIPGLTSGIFEKLGLENPNVPVFRLLGSENTGGDNVNESMNFAAIPGQTYRLVNNATGEVLGEASTPEGISALVQQSNALSTQLGKNADLSFETSTPEVFGGGYSPIFQDQPNELVGGFLGNVMDVALPALASIVVPGAGLVGTVLPAAGASAASSLMQERGLKETLARAALTGAGAGLGEALLASGLPTGNVVGQTPSLAGDALANLPSLLDDIAATAAQNVASAGFGAVAPAAASGLTGDIIATAIKTAAPSVVGSAAGAAASGALPNLITQPAQVQQPVNQEYTPPPENLIVTATQPNVTGIFPAVTGGVSNTLIDQIVNQAPTAPTGPTAPTTPPAEPVVTDGEIVVTAQPGTPVVPPFVPPIVVPPGILPPATTPTTPAKTTPPTKKDVFGTGLTAAELLAAAGIGSSLISSLIGGGGSGGATATPYVSPFGAGSGGFGAGVDYRVNPNIADYERYGFGPEASFFRPEYNTIVSGAAGGTGFQSNPTYTPLINSGPVAAQPTYSAGVQGGYAPRPPGSNPGADFSKLMTSGLQGLFPSIIDDKSWYAANPNAGQASTALTREQIEKITS